METATNQRPNRWDEPFGEMTPDDVAQVMSTAPFSQFDPQVFPARLPLEGIIANDTRINHYQEGDIVIREGDYGNSAFLILDGRVDVSLVSLPEELLGRASPRKRGWFQTIAQLWKRNPGKEFRQTANALGNSIGARQADSETRIFLQDVPAVLDENRTASIGAGELFGEMAALSRSPRTASVIARGKVTLLEIRWQGLRELIKYDGAMKKYVDDLYRENSLLVHLRETPILRHLSGDDLLEVAESATFSSYGDFDWQNHFRQINRKELDKRIAMEPVVAGETEYVNHLTLIRSGFARMSRQVGSGHRTLAYLGKGEVYGLREILRCWKSDDQPAYEFSLRAVGHVEVISIPIKIVTDIILPNLSSTQVDELLNTNWMSNIEFKSEPADATSKLDTSLIEFLGEHRFINGTETMLIDLDRCTRCDDCVRACADTHDNNPRFNREGPKFGNQMVASACMHCVDPVCMIGCPTGAIGRDPATGSILINDLTCVGCTTCANSCPYDNIKMVEITDRNESPIVDNGSGLPILKATKCDLCTDQVGGPACVRACPHDALIRINTNDTNTLNQWIKR